MTSSNLSNQLKKIALNNPFKQALQQQRNRPSLLFDGKQAADLGLDTIYALGINGLLELKSLDVRFDWFEQTLFAESMKSFDRTQKTPEENAKLNESVEKFLRLVGPFMLLKPASKALEWLIRRFRINEFSVDAILACALPYHETNIFIKLIGMIDFEGVNSRWKFLGPIAKKRIPMDRASLIAHAIRNPGILKFLCDTVLTAGKTKTLHKTLISFVTAVLIQYVQQVDRVTENVLLDIMPYLLQFTEESEHVDLQIAAYMVISQLATRATFSGALCASILDRITRNTTTRIQDVLMCVIVLVQSQQEALAEIPSKAARRICSDDEFVSSMQPLAQEYDLETLFFLLLKSLTGKVSKNSSLIQLIIESFDLSTECIALVADACLSALLEQDESASDSKVAQLFRVLHLRHGTVVDSVIEKRMELVKKDQASEAKLFKVIANEFQGTKHEAFEDSRVTVSLSLQHPEKQIRMMGLRKLFSLNFENQETLEFARDNLLARLEEDDNGVLEFILSEEKLTQVFPANFYVNICISLLSRKSVTDQVKATSVRRLAELEMDTDLLNMCVESLLPYSMTTEATESTAFAILEVFGHFSSHPLLQGFEAMSLSSDGDKSSALACTRKTVELLAKNCHENIATWKKIYSNGNCRSRILCLLVLNKAVQLEKSANQYQVARLILSHFKSSLKTECETMPTEEQLFDSLYCASKLSQLQAVEPMAYNFSLGTILQHLSQPGRPVFWLKSIDTADNATKEYMLVIAVLFSTIILLPTSMKSQLMGTLMRNHLSHKTPEFLLSLTCVPLKMLKSTVVEASLAVFHQYLVANLDSMNLHWTIAFLLPLLQSTEKQVRYYSLQSLEVFFGSESKNGEDSSKKNTGKCEIYGSDDLVKSISLKRIKSVLKAVHFRYSEILTDSAAIGGAISEYFSVKNLKQDDRAEMFSWLLSHAAACNITGFRLNLLQLFSDVQTELKLKTQFSILQHLSQKMENCLAGTGEIGLTECEQELMKLSCNCLVPSSALKIEGKSSLKNALFALLKSYTNRSHSNSAISTQLDELQTALVRRFTPAFFKEFSEENQSKFVGYMIDYLVTGSQRIIKSTRKMLNELPISVDIISKELASALAGMNGSIKNSERPAKKSTADVQEDNTVVKGYNRILAIMELLQSKTNIADDRKLIPVAFEILGSLLQLQCDTNMSLSFEYTKQLILTFLLQLLKRNKDRKAQLDESQFRVDLLVQCIRATDNPQTHNQALLLLATASSIFPEKVLHNIMSIFTFMGASVMRQDDNYSFFVIQQTIERIIPPLIESRRKTVATSEDLILSVKDILEVFNNALFHVPKHRRLRLMAILISTLNPEPFLYGMTVMMLARYLSDDIMYPKQESEPVVEFSMALFNQFDPTTQIDTLTRMVRWFMASQAGTPEALDLINQRNISTQTQQVHAAVLGFVSKILANQNFLSKVAAFRAGSHDSLEKTFLNLVETLLEAIQQSERVKSQECLNIIFEAVERVNDLLGTPSFVGIARELFCHENANIRMKALALFNNRLERYSKSAVKEENAAESFITIMKELKEMLESATETPNNRQVALAATAKLCKAFSKTHANQLMSLLPSMSCEFCLLSKNQNVQAASFIALASGIEALGPRSLTVLNISVSTAIETVHQQIKVAGGSNFGLIEAALRLIQSVTDNLPQFCSPYLPSILACIYHPKVIGMAPGKQQEIAQTAQKIIDSVATKVPTRILLSPLLVFLKKASEYGITSLLKYFGTLETVIAQLNRDAIVSSYKHIFKFFLGAFDFRSTAAGMYQLSDVHAVENATVKAFMQLVMKMNETLFKPLFLKMIDWAFTEATKEQQERAHNRQIFLFHLTDILLNQLKSIFAPYFTYLLDYCVAVLAQCAETQHVDELWRQMMRSLHKCILYDNDGFLSEENMKSLMKPLVDQLSVVAATSESEEPDSDELDTEQQQQQDRADYMKRMQDYVIPCLGQLAAASRQDAILKPLNQAVLMKTRDSDHPEVRLAALHVIHEFYQTMGDDFLAYLPETVPFLSELMEDDDEQVERYTQQVIRLMEQYLGESLQEHLK